MLWSIGMLWLPVIALLAPLSWALPSSIPMTQLSNGKMVMGKMLKSPQGRDYSVFYGIPYGLPPVGERRFKDPVKAPLPTSSELVIPFTEPKPLCLQYRRYGDDLLQGQEDCLRVTIYTPYLEAPTRDVVVVIHGGGFMYSAGAREGFEVMMDLGVVVVQVDYRVGILGFLSTEDAELPGNLGLRDQVMALEWVRDNIGPFGGNNKSVTLFGYSAGSASLLMHTLSPLSKGLFHRGIGQSGSPLNPWSQQHDSRKKAEQLGQLMGCPTNNSRVLVQCLRNKDPAEIVRLTPVFQPWMSNPFSPFRPVVDRAHKHPFLPEEPYSLLSKKKSMNVPLLLSCVTSEGLFTAGDFIANATLMKELDSRFAELAPLLMHYNDSLPQEQREMVARRIKEEYLGNTTTMFAQNTSALVQAMGDRNFVVGIEKHVRMQAAVGPVYFFRLLYRGAVSISELLTHNKNNYGVSHADDMQYVMNMSWSNLTTVDDKAMRTAFLGMWSSFLQTSVPVIPDMGATWKPVLANQPDLMHVDILGPKKYEMRMSRQLGHNDFWSSLPFHENERISPSRGSSSATTCTSLVVIALAFMHLMC